MSIEAAAIRCVTVNGCFCLPHFLSSMSSEALEEKRECNHSTSFMCFATWDGQAQDLLLR